MSETRLESRIHEVTVYARGAVVRRTATLPEGLPPGAVELVLGDLPVQADPGSLRASVEGGRDVVGLVSRLVTPPSPPPRPELEVRLEDLRRELARLEAEHEEACGLRDLAGGTTLQIALRNRRDRPDPLARTTDVLATRALLEDLARPHDTRARELERALEGKRRELNAVELEASQARSAAVTTRPATREVSVRLAPGEAAKALVLEYVVPAARWWPAYTARLADGGTRATWQLEAFVAQQTGEDWTAVKLGLATSDLVRDVRLPTLPSLRLGRAQPPAKRGYRAAPEGLDELFAGYDKVRHLLAKPAPEPPRPPPPPPPPPPSPRAVRRGRAEPEGAIPDESDDEVQFEREEARKERKRDAPRPPPLPAPMAMPSMSRAIAPGAPPKPSPSKKKAGAPMEELASAIGGGLAESALMDAAPEEAPAPVLAIEPQDGWLDFDQLQLAGSESSQRGRLARHGPSAASGPSPESFAAPSACRDPRDTRGLFDHRYDGAAPCDVPSSGRAHRVTLVTAEARPTPRLVVVPRETTEVFRSAEATNPFDAPLIPGPVDVLVDGALVTTSTLEPVDRGGLVSLPIGLEERVRVARNVRVREETAGLLGGSTHVVHDVSIELSSSLGFAVTVEVRERVPVTDDKELEIALASSKPAHDKYDQAERGAPVRGGVRWKVALAPGGKAVVEYSYRLGFSAKSEIVGGNRRD